MSMEPTSNGNNVNVQQVSNQPLYDPPVYAQSAMNQVGNQPCPPPYLGTYNGYPQGAANPMIRQPMMYQMNWYPINNGAQFVPVHQYPPQQQTPMNMGYSNAPVHDGQNATNFRFDIPPPVIAENAPTLAQSEKEQNHVEQVVSSNRPPFEELPMKTQEFLRALDESQRSKSLPTSSSEVAKTSEDTPELGEELDSSSIEKHFEQHMSQQKQILQLLKPKPSTGLDPFAAPESYKIAMSRFEAMKKPVNTNAPKQAQKKASTVFIYDIDDITQLTYDITRAVKRMFPDLKTTAKIIESLPYWFSKKFFEYNEDQGRHTTVMNVKDGHFGTKINEYLELKNKCEASGPNFVYELIKAYAEDKAREEEARNIQKKTDLTVSLAQAIEFQALFEQPWQSAKKCLQAITDKSLKNTYANVVISNGIGNGVGRLLISGLASDVPLKNIYSSRRLSMREVLKRIQRDFGKNCSFVVVTSDDKTVEAAEKRNMRVWHVEDAESLDALYNAQKLQMLK